MLAQFHERRLFELSFMADTSIIELLEACRSRGFPRIFKNEAKYVEISTQNENWKEIRGNTIEQGSEQGLGFGLF